MRRQIGFWLLLIALTAVAAADIAVNGWYTISSSTRERNASLAKSTASASRIARIPSGREFTTSIEATEIERLVIENPAGSVVVHASADNDEIELQAWLIVYTKDETESKEALEQVQITVEMDGGIARPKFDPDPSRYLAVDSPWDILWEISVPDHVDVDIVNRDGPVTVQGLSGTLQITNERGLVDTSEINGMIRVILTDGQLEARQVDGVLEVLAHHSQLTLNDVVGSIAIEGTDTVVVGNSLQGDSRFDVTSGGINLNEISGDISLRSIDTNVLARTLLNLRELNVDITGQNAIFEIAHN